MGVYQMTRTQEIALAKLAQAVVDSAVAMCGPHWYEHNGWALVPIGQMQDLVSAVNALDAAGGKTYGEDAA